jgi:hypothetical protein
MLKSSLSQELNKIVFEIYKKNITNKEIFYKKYKPFSAKKYVKLSKRFRLFIGVLLLVKKSEKKIITFLKKEKRNRIAKPFYLLLKSSKSKNFNFIDSFYLSEFIKTNKRNILKLRKRRYRNYFKRGTKETYALDLNNKKFEYLANSKMINNYIGVVKVKKSKNNFFFTFANKRTGVVYYKCSGGF